MIANRNTCRKIYDIWYNPTGFVTYTSPVTVGAPLRHLRLISAKKSGNYNQNGAQTSPESANIDLKLPEIAAITQQSRGRP